MHSDPNQNARVQPDITSPIGNNCDVHAFSFLANSTGSEVPMSMHVIATPITAENGQPSISNEVDLMNSANERQQIAHMVDFFNIIIARDMNVRFELSISEEYRMVTTLECLTSYAISSPGK